MAIQWRNEHYLDQVQLPNDQNTYYLRDAEARDVIDTLSNATHFLGVTTTVLTDGDTTNPITINSQSITAVSGDIVIYNAGTELAPENKEFIWNGTAWQEFGDPSIQNLGNLAFADTASGSYTPSGTITVTPTTSNVIDSVSHNFGVEVVLSDNNVSGDKERYDLPIEYSSAQRDIINNIYFYTDGQEYFQVSQTYLPEQPTEIVHYIQMRDTSTDVVTDFTQGSLPSITNTLSLTATVTGTTLTFNLSDIGFNAGSLPSVSIGSILELSSVHYTSVSTNQVEISYNTETVDYIENLSVSPTYYKVDLTGNLTTTSTSTLTGATATFAGTASTITVNPNPKNP